MAVTLTNADKALKSYYLDVVASQLNLKANPLLSMVKQSTDDVWGKEIRKLAVYGMNGGIGAGTEDGDLPNASGNNYEQFVATLKNLYGTIEISDKAVRASENNSGAFVSLLNAEMEGLLKASSFNFGRMLFGDGSGKLGTVSAITDGVITLDRRDDSGFQNGGGRSNLRRNGKKDTQNGQKKQNHYRKRHRAYHRNGCGKIYRYRSGFLQQRNNGARRDFLFERLYLRTFSL